jgi:hypothetical protein
MEHCLYSGVKYREKQSCPLKFTMCSASSRNTLPKKLHSQNDMTRFQQAYKIVIKHCLSLQLSQTLPFFTGKSQIAKPYR